MSVAIAMNVHDGVILAADSASTLSVIDQANPGQSHVANVYNNANKIANLLKGRPIGCVTFGSGSIGNASISTLLKDFRKKITTDGTFDRDNYSMEQVATLLTDFLGSECAKQGPGTPKTNVGLFLGGYSTGGSLGERWAINIHESQPKPPVKLHKNPEDVGITWGGEGGEAIARLVMGHGNRLPMVLNGLLKPPGTADKLMKVIGPQLRAQLMFAPMPIQDAIDLADFLVHTAIQFSRFLPGAQVVGGPIEIAAITKHEGFKWIRRKHYYGVELNREVGP